MNYELLTTDELCDIITQDIGVPIPTYNYDCHQYVSAVPKNIEGTNGMIGIEDFDVHDTLRDACLRIIQWKENHS